MFYEDGFAEETDLIANFKEDGAFLCWVMAMHLERSDVFELAANSLTDGGGDKKIDFIDLDIENGKITLAQGYYTKKMKDEAPANKASDLNTAGAWLISGDLKLIPETLREIISNCREAISNDEISEIELVYVHNLPESINCSRELKTVASHLSKMFKDEDIEISSKELGKMETEKLYTIKESQILVKDKITIHSEPFFKEVSSEWDAYVFSVSGKWLHELYEQYGDNLFSANYRGFLGSNKRKKINNAIKQSAENNAENFWAFNNGITILTTNVSPIGGGTVFDGMSIINGAQTTGSLGSLDSSKLTSLDNVKVLCRVIKCSDPNLIAQIVKNNNTQNAITSWDTYSNDEYQKSLKESFEALGHSYSLKRGFFDEKSDFGIFSVGQPTLAFEGSYAEASRGKNRIFQRQHLYKSVFENKKPRHFLLTYSLAKAFDQVKAAFKHQFASNKNPSTNDMQRQAMLSNMNFKTFFLSVVGECLETILGTAVDKEQISISPDWAQKTIEEIRDNWTSSINALLAIMTQITKKQEIGEVIRSKEKYTDLCDKMIMAISTQKEMGTLTFPEDFVQMFTPS